MDVESILKISDFEREGKTREGFVVLEELANKNDPLAIIELGSRYICTEGYTPEILKIEKDEIRGHNLIENGNC